MQHLHLTGLEPRLDPLAANNSSVSDTPLALPLWAFQFDRTPGNAPSLHLYNVSLTLPHQEFQLLLAGLPTASGPAGQQQQQHRALLAGTEVGELLLQVRTQPQELWDPERLVHYCSHLFLQLCLCCLPGPGCQPLLLPTLLHATATAASQVQAARPCYSPPCFMLLPLLPPSQTLLLLFTVCMTPVCVTPVCVTPVCVTIYTSSQVQAASPQLIVLDAMSVWGVNGSLVTLLPDQPLPLPTGITPPGSVSSSSSTGMSSGVVAGIVVGSVVGAVALLGVLLLLLLPHRYVQMTAECYCLPLCVCHSLLLPATPCYCRCVCATACYISHQEPAAVCACYCLLPLLPHATPCYCLLPRYCLLPVEGLPPWTATACHLTTACLLPRYCMPPDNCYSLCPPLLLLATAN